MEIEDRIEYHHEGRKVTRHIWNSTGSSKDEVLLDSFPENIATKEALLHYIRKCGIFVPR